MESRRVEALVDGVFAIAMTLLVLQVRVPELHAPPTAAGMLDALGQVLPAAGAYAVSFLILGTLWFTHHQQSRLIERIDAPLLWSNLFFLLAVAFIPFATAFLARYPLQPASLALYGGTLLMAGMFLFAQWSHAVGRGLVIEAVTPEVAEVVRERISMGLAAYLAATLVGALLPKVGLVLFAAVPALYLLPRRIDPALAGEASSDE